MRRRLHIAASIVATPQLMFLDSTLPLRVTLRADHRARPPLAQPGVGDRARARRGGHDHPALHTYLEEADQLADGIAGIDRGRVIAEGTPVQLKASVGTGALHVRVLDPEQRADAAALLARAVGTVYPGVWLNTYLTRGVVDRFRSLPIWRPAPVAGVAARRHRPLRHRGHGHRRAGRRAGLPPGRQGARRAGRAGEPDGTAIVTSLLVAAARRWSSCR
jgi:hypothetical protein